MITCSLLLVDWAGEVTRRMGGRVVRLGGGIPEAGRSVRALGHSRPKSRWIVASHVMGRLRL